MLETTQKLILMYLPLASVLLAAIGIYYQIKKFNSEKETQKLTALRSSVTKLRTRLSHYIEVTSRPTSVSDIAFTVTEHCLAFAKKDVSHQGLSNLSDFSAMLCDKDTADFIKHAITAGLHKSDSRKELLHQADQIKEIPFQQEVALPFISEIVGACVYYVTEAIRNATSSEIYDEVINSLVTKHESKANSSNQNNNEGPLLFRDFSLLIHERTEKSLKDDAMPIVDAAITLLDLSTSFLLDLSDKKLKEIIELDKNMFFNTSPKSVEEPELVTIILNVTAIIDEGMIDSFLKQEYLFRVEIRRLAELTLSPDEIFKLVEQFPLLNVSISGQSKSTYEI
ncbi:hypothetical protein CXF72_09195 [Psychromonas sp. MB-3u-54]|uniref:hypothetical protein n=1 Tax=Psychromonas sp. MB-3u-54 TaxID=2058319 RepID=UPI000C32C7BE|nr:hypothetical protein [Psychromonas sp. MB-3u-54]PKH02882.1 hypothetical protein CXF72_09195 [Psychromonas sp. MB-3u-54]